MIEIIKDNNFSQLHSIGHAFFTRQGGVSKASYNSLNCNDTCGDMCGKTNVEHWRI